MIKKQLFSQNFVVVDIYRNLSSEILSTLTLQIAIPAPHVAAAVPVHETDADRAAPGDEAEAVTGRGAGAGN